MKLEDFQLDYDYRPVDVEEFAQAASKVSDCPELAQAAKDCINSEERFKFMLGKYGVTIG